MTIRELIRKLILLDTVDIDSEVNLVVELTNAMALDTIAAVRVPIRSVVLNGDHLEIFGK